MYKSEAQAYQAMRRYLKQTSKRANRNFSIGLQGMLSNKSMQSTCDKILNGFKHLTPLENKIIDRLTPKDKEPTKEVTTSEVIDLIFKQPYEVLKIYRATMLSKVRDETEKIEMRAIYDTTDRALAKLKQAAMDLDKK